MKNRALFPAEGPFSPYQALVDPTLATPRKASFGLLPKAIITQLKTPWSGPERAGQYYKFKEESFHW